MLSPIVADFPSVNAMVSITTVFGAPCVRTGNCFGSPLSGTAIQKTVKCSC